MGWAWPGWKKNRKQKMFNNAAKVKKRKKREKN